MARDHLSFFLVLRQRAKRNLQDGESPDVTFPQYISHVGSNTCKTVVGSFLDFHFYLLSPTLQWNAFAERFWRYPLAT